MCIVPPPSFAADKWDNTEVCLSGVVERIEYRDSGDRLYLNHVNCDSSQGELSLELSEFSNVSCICDIEAADIRLGSVVTLTGTLRALSQATNPGEFDYRAYCAVQEIYFLVEDATISRSSEAYNVLGDALFRLREAGVTLLKKYLTKEDAGVLSAMLLGERAGLETADRQLFQQSGISHILAISGLHISLLGMGFYRILERMRLPYVINMMCVIMLMALYGVMTGMSSSACRAILMFAIKLNARRVGRTYDMLTALSVAAVCILIEQPRYVFHAGFRLSFGAVIGMGCVAPVLESVYGKGRRKGITGKVRRSLYGSLSVALVTLPILLYHYYEYSVYSVFLNLVILPTVGVVAGSGVCLLLCGGVWGFGARVLATVCTVMLWLYRAGSALLLELPGAVQIIGKPRVYQIVFYVAGMVLLLGLSVHKERRLRDRKKGIWKYRLAGVVVIGASILCLMMPIRRGMQLTFLDVGQGDGACIQVRNGHGILIDCGSMNRRGLTDYQLIPFLKSQGIHTLDAVFLSHLDEDHISGVVGLLESGESRIYIRQIVLSAYVPQDEAWEELVRLAGQAGVPIVYIKQGTGYVDEKLGITCLYPVVASVSEERNAQSMVLLLEYGEFQALFTGDMDAAGERALLNELPENFECEVLKVAHHGSRYSSMEEFLERINPKVAIISCSESNSYGHPHEETLERLQEEGALILTTPEYGAIIFEIGEDIRARTFKHR